MTKEVKTIVFRKWAKVEMIHPADVDEMKKVLVEDFLSRGYVPLEPKHMVLYYPHDINAIDRVWTHAAYAGKVRARKIGVQPWPDTGVKLSVELRP